MILIVTVQSPGKTPSRKQRLQERQRRQLAVVDMVDKAEMKVRKAEAELAMAVVEAVEVFGDEDAASQGLDMPVETLRRFVDLAVTARAAADEDGA